MFLSIYFSQWRDCKKHVVSPVLVLVGKSNMLPVRVRIDLEVQYMKKLEIVIRPEKVAQMKTILSETGARGAMFTSISGYGSQKSKQYVFRGQPYFEQIFLKTKVETYVTDEVAEKIIERVLAEIPTGEIGDGKIFISDFSEVIRIRTGERGEEIL